MACTVHSFPYANPGQLFFYSSDCLCTVVVVLVVCAGFFGVRSSLSPAANSSSSAYTVAGFTCTTMNRDKAPSKTASQNLKDGN